MKLLSMHLYIQRVILTPDTDRKLTEDSDDGGDHRPALFQTASPKGKSLSVYYHKQCLVSSFFDLCSQESYKCDFKAWFAVQG